MAVNILTDTNLRMHMDKRDQLIKRLDQAEALAHVSLSEQFYTSPHRLMHSYLSLLEDIILKAQQAL